VTPPRRALPSGTVTFVFTDIEGSTKLLHDLGSERYADALAEHRQLLRAAFGRHGGVEVDTQGDAFFYAFSNAQGAVDAAREGSEALEAGPIHVRVGIHTGTPHVTGEGYVGPDVHKGARIGAAGHGGQILLSLETRTVVDAEVTDLGEHRLKDFAGPVQIFQVGDDRFPPLKTISNTNLPHPASTFVGRDKEVREVVSLLTDGARLLSLTGPGGSGKTRLAIEAASEALPEFKAGVFWVGLATIRDPALVTETIAQTLGAKGELADHIAEREMLLLLDNLEQVIDAAPDLSKLVEACPNLRVLSTTRELLRVRGEVEYPVLPLDEPEAIDLFCTRAKTEPDDIIRELCSALDNLPLALELAAARSAVLSPRQILERVSQRLDLLKGGRDADPRQRTLRATIEWSHDLLTPEEQKLFARLSVFRGGCTIEAATRVAGAGFDALQSLVDKSLVRHTAERFWMLETIREFAVERLEESGEAARLRRSHADHFLSFAEEAARHDLRWNREWLDRLESEHDNLRAALDLFEAGRESELFVRIAAAIWRLWQLHNHRAEGKRRLDDALAADRRPTAARAMALNGAAVLAGEGGDGATARLRAAEALAINTSLGDASGIAFSTFMLAGAALDEGDPLQARALFEESVRLFQDAGDEKYELLASRNIAGTYYESGDRERARAIHEENLTRARAMGIREMEEDIVGTLAEYALEDGRVADALPLLIQSLRMSQELEDQLEIALNLRRFGRALTLMDRAAPAARLLSVSETLREEIGFKRSWFRELDETTLAAIRSQLGPAAFDEEWALGRKLTVDQAIELALESAV
jgi:predicted ATPase/class 3 adenylate cyclase